MEKSKVREAEEVTLEELEAQHVEVLPDRIELRRRRSSVRQEASVTQAALGVAGDDVDQLLAASIEQNA